MKTRVTTKIQLFFLLTVITNWIGNAQFLENKRNENVIQVSKSYKTILVFPEEIAEDVLGNDLEFGREIIEKEDKFYHRRIVKLYYIYQAKEKQNRTNYTVITKSGDIYEFLLQETSQPTKTAYEILRVDANGNIHYAGNRTINGSKNVAGKQYDHIVGAPYTYYTQNNNQTVEFNDLGMQDSHWYYADKSELDSLYAINKIAYYKIQCHKNKKNKELGKGRDFEHSGKIYLWLKGVYFQKNEIYIDLVLENKESVDYVVDFAKAKLSTNYRKKSSKQSVNHKALFVYNLPKKVMGSTSQRFQMVFDRFTISDKRILEIEIKEKNGERDVRIEIPKEMITNPIKI